MLGASRRTTTALKYAAPSCLRGYLRTHDQFGATELNAGGPAGLRRGYLLPGRTVSRLRERVPLNIRRQVRHAPRNTGRSRLPRHGDV